MKQKYALNLLIMLFLLALSIPVYAAEDTSYAEKVSHTFRAKKESQSFLLPLLNKDFAKFYEILKAEHQTRNLGYHASEWTIDPERNKKVLIAINEMEKQYPNDALFLTVKGMILFNLAYMERGTDWGRNTSKEQFEKFEQIRLLARNDLEKALTIDKKMPEAWATLIDIAVTYPGNHHHEIF